MISLDEARRLMLAAVKPMEAEQVAIGEALSRVLAADVTAGSDQPALRMSAMDGYAVRAADAIPGARLQLIGNAFAGAPFEGVITPGTAVHIATGGVVPEGADRVMMQEIVTRDDDVVTLTGQLHDEHFVRPTGGDYRTGEVLLHRGQLLNAARLGLAAAANCATLMVHRKLRTAIFASGDELREPGARLGRGQVCNSAAYAVEALVNGWGGAAVRKQILPDNREQCSRMIKAARSESDLLVFIGGASVGDRDVLRHAIADLGGELMFDRIAIQPGKPSWSARFSDGRLALGLPGNPASAFVCAHLLLEPLIAAYAGRKSQTRVHSAMLTGTMPASEARETYWRAKAAIDSDGRLVVALDPRRDSSLQTPLASANALVRQMPLSPESQPGAIVDVIMLGGGDVVSSLIV